MGWLATGNSGLVMRLWDCDKWDCEIVTPGIVGLRWDGEIVTNGIVGMRWDGEIVSNGILRL